MAKPPAKLDEQIAELEAVVRDLETCAKCGKPLEPDQARCPNCGAIVGEEIELPKLAAKVAPAERPAVREAPSPATEAPREAPAPEVAAPPATKAAPAVPAGVQPPEVPEEPAEEEIIEEPVVEEAETPAEPAEEEVEAPVPSEEEEAEAPSEAEPEAAVHVAPRGEGPVSRRRPALVVAGVVLYVLGLAGFLPYLGKYMGASVMVIASVVVAAGIAMRGSPAPRAASVPPVASERKPEGKAPSRAMEFVCPLCGTPAPLDAAKCETCGAEFEE